jgi:Ni/Co efflux regulator RcnB
MKRVVIAIVAFCVVFAPMAAAAAGQGRGQDKSGGPPGLAKKPYGLPPGQAKKMWRKGEKIPTTYIAPQYFVPEPRVYHLAPPPPGYRWVAVEGDAYLVQTTSGLIADVIADAVAGLIR